MNTTSGEVLHGRPLRQALAAPTEAEERAGVLEVPLSDGPTLWPHTAWLLGAGLLGGLAALLWALIPNVWGGLAAFHALCGAGVCYLVSYDCLEEYHRHWRMEWFDPDLSAPAQGQEDAA